MRNSITDPLMIAEVQAAPGYGKIGITLCPGKKHTGMSGGWDRDLGLDLDAVARWGAALVITLVEKHELERLGVGQLSAEVEARHMAWYHYPMVDAGVPDPAIAGSWSVIGEDCRALLRDGFNVLLHCKGGLGRAGTMAAMLLTELGVYNERAIELVREARPGAIENKAQEIHVIRTTAEGEPLPGSDYIEDRAVGAMIGLAIGDALGTTLEFTRRDSQPRVTDLVGGGPFKLEPGQWTDDTAMALALLDSLAFHANLDEADLMRRFLFWYETGEYSCTGRCFDIGITTRAALARFKADGHVFAGSTDPRSAGNGSLMRLAPVAIRHWQDRELMRDIAARQSRTTHGAPEAVDACIAFTEVLADAIEGRPRSQVMRTRDYPYAGNIGGIMAGSWRGKHRDDIRASGYVAHSLEAALWCVGRTSSFEEAVVLAANLGDDADTTAAITGQLAGALYGMGGIPDRWIEQIAWSERIMETTRTVFEAGCSG